jgi:hypothetical protein
MYNYFMNELETLPSNQSLLHRELYKSPEWLSLNKVDRVQLLFVAEGAKP